MDMLGFGDSVKPDEPVSIEACALGAVALLDALDLPCASIVGHHTGGVVAIELAATHPERVDRLVLSSTSLVDARARARAHERPPIDEVEPRADGSHLTELWQRRQGFYPPDRPDLLHRFVLDAMRVLDRVEEGHRAVHRYAMEQRLDSVSAPTMVIVGTEDPFVYPRFRRLVEHLPGSEVREIPGGMVPMVDQLPAEFSEAVLDFLGRP
jgi:pimeloyl-ACP methyl ester carboxylesterase